MKALLIGKSGQLGRQLLELWPDSIAPSREQLDLARPQEAADFVRASGADLVINTSAFHNVPACEQEKRQAFAINALGVKALAEACAESGARFLTFSTDYVFDGSKKAPYVEEDHPNPVQVYGTSKLAGERLALAVHPKGAFVVRTCGVYGNRDAGSFEQRIIEAGDSFEVGSDQIISPTYSRDLTTAVVQLVSSGFSPGIYHLTNEGHCTWQEFAEEAFRLLGKSTKAIPVKRSGNVRRPLFSALANEKAAANGLRLPHWKDGLARYLAGFRREGDKN